MLGKNQRLSRPQMGHLQLYIATQNNYSKLSNMFHAHNSAAANTSRLIIPSPLLISRSVPASLCSDGSHPLSEKNLDPIIMAPCKLCYN